MPTSIFTKCVATAVQWALPISLSLATSCRTTDVATGAASVVAAADSITAMSTTHADFSLSDDIKVEIAEWYIYTDTADTLPHMMRHTTIIRNRRHETSRHDTSATTAVAANLKTETAKQAKTSRPAKPGIIHLLAIGITAIIVISTFIKSLKK